MTGMRTSRNTVGYTTLDTLQRRVENAEAAIAIADYRTDRAEQDISQMAVYAADTVADDPTFETAGAAATYVAQRYRPQFSAFLEPIDPLIEGKPRKDIERDIGRTRRLDERLPVSARQKPHHGKNVGEWVTELRDRVEDLDDGLEDIDERYDELLGRIQAVDTEIESYLQED